MVVGVISWGPSFEVVGIVVPAIFIDVVNVERRPEIVEVAVGVGGQPVEVEIPVVTSLRVPHAEPWIVVEIELYTGLENHADHPDLSEL
nr:hypothetical protein [Halomicroarcula sp. DFY41]